MPCLSSRIILRLNATGWMGCCMIDGVRVGAPKLYQHFHLEWWTPKADVLVSQECGTRTYSTSNKANSDHLINVDPAVNTSNIFDLTQGFTRAGPRGQGTQKGVHKANFNAPFDIWNDLPLPSLIGTGKILPGQVANPSGFSL